jgi:hypothetical protein
LNETKQPQLAQQKTPPPLVAKAETAKEQAKQNQAAQACSSLPKRVPPTKPSPNVQKNSLLNSKPILLVKNKSNQNLAE